MPGIMTPDNILAALESRKSELPSLTGKEAWEGIEDEFHRLKRMLQESDDSEERDRLASELIDLLVPYKHARDQLREEIHLQNNIRADIRAVLRDTLETADLPAFAAKIGVDNKIVEPSADVIIESIVVDDLEEVRRIEIGKGGEHGKSAKIRNFHLNLRSMTELITGAIPVIIAPNPLIVVAGTLQIICSLTKAITIPLSEEETSVFWGFVLARDRDNSAEESLIAKYTNDERVKHGRLPFTNEGVRDALHRLEKLKSIELVEGKQDTWRIVEKYEIK
ncbi:MAG: hypothetical protein U9N46_05350 [Euryarchaeota archaeon]|nr:MAG: hypothetical protein C5S48_01890 [ANME-2 cluster archaeon]MEA1864608.1 hypothetical protein [Euryarchaeota archaeon]